MSVASGEEKHGLVPPPQQNPVISVTSEFFRWLIGSPVKLGLVGLTCIAAYAVGHVYHVVGFWPELAFEVVRDLGIACWIGFIISVGVEQIARKELNSSVDSRLQGLHRTVAENMSEQGAITATQIEEIGERSIKAVYDRALPADFLRFFDRVLAEHRFYKTGTHLSLEITPIDKDDHAGIPAGTGTEEMVLVTISSTFTIKNLSPVDQFYPLRIFVDKPLVPGLENLVTLKSLAEGPAGNQLKPIPIEEMDAASANWEDTDTQKRWGHDFLIQGDGGTRCISLSYSSVLFRRDKLNWCTLQPADGLNVTVVGPRDFSKRIDGLHPDELDTVSTLETTLVRHINAPLYPLHGVEISWMPTRYGPSSS